jgi:hypothetical protein
MDNVALAQIHLYACRHPSDIKDRLLMLSAFVRECRHVANTGMQTDASTTSLLFPRPENLIHHGRVRYAHVDRRWALPKRAECAMTQ